MKYLLVLMVIVIAVGVWRSQRRAEAQQRQRTQAPGRQPLSAPQDMVECAHCGLHLPRGEAVQAGGHSYCSTEHLAQSRAPKR